LTSLLVAAGVVVVGSATVWWTVTRYGAAIYLRLNDVIELTQELAPLVQSLLRDLTSSAGLPCPRLFVVRGTTPVAFAVKGRSRDAVGLSERAFENLSSAELQGAIGMLVAALANPDLWGRGRRLANWFVTDALAATLTERSDVVGALKALALTETESSTNATLGVSQMVARTLARLSRDVFILLPREPPVLVRIAHLGELVPTAGPSSPSTPRSPQDQ
jgi:hypothetical protein